MSTEEWIRFVKSRGGGNRWTAVWRAEEGGLVMDARCCVDDARDAAAV